MIQSRLFDDDYLDELYGLKNTSEIKTLKNQDEKSDSQGGIS